MPENHRPAIAKTLAEIEKGRAYVISLEPEVTLLEAAIARFQGEFPPIQKYASSLESPAMRIGIGYHFSEMRGALLQINMQDLNDVKKVLNFVRAFDYRMTKKGSYPEANRMSFFFAKKDAKLDHWKDAEDKKQIVISAFLVKPFDGEAVCKFVQVGTEEKPIYEVQCAGKKAVVFPEDS